MRGFSTGNSVGYPALSTVRYTISWAARVAWLQLLVLNGPWRVSNHPPREVPLGYLLERWPSGLRHPLWKRMFSSENRGFESLPLRQSPSGIGAVWSDPHVFVA